MSDELKCFGFYEPKEGYTIHVIDENPSSVVAQLEDLSQVEKYVMSDEDYDGLPSNMRKFLKNLRKNNPELFTTEKAFTTNPDHMKELADKFEVSFLQ